MKTPQAIRMQVLERFQGGVDVRAGNFESFRVIRERMSCCQSVNMPVIRKARVWEIECGVSIRVWRRRGLFTAECFRIGDTRIMHVIEGPYSYGHAKISCPTALHWYSRDPITPLMCVPFDSACPGPSAL